MTTFDQTPDAPQGFGYKTLWFSIKASDPALVIDALGFGPATPANWESGLAAAYSNGDRETPWVFVSPPIDGWVLAMSSRFPYPVTIDANQDLGRKFDILFSRLMKRFDEVQFFGGHRSVGFVTWARALGGDPIRIYGFAEADVLANFGAQTAEEAQLGFVDLSGLSPSDASEKIFTVAEERDSEEERLIASGVSPGEAVAHSSEGSRHPIPDESDVVDLAALWSIDPTLLSDEDHQPGVGLAVRLPDDLAQ
jgi:hypothetical protein